MVVDAFVKLKETVSDIKKLKIQGAENVALSSVNAFKEFITSYRPTDKGLKAFQAKLGEGKRLFFESRPTEPCMRNALTFILEGSFPDIESTKKAYLSRIDEVLKHFELIKKIIPEIGAKKIRDGMVVFTHCHSSTVVDILLLAKKQGRKFEVHNTETRPLFQGRKTAKELAKAGIKVSHYPDSAARIALKKADLCFFGCDAITTDKIFNKIGSEIFCEIANNFEVPVYICSDSWKFDVESIYGTEEIIEERDKDEVWKTRDKNIEIKNYAFEKIDPKLVSGIISELGIFDHPSFLSEFEENYKFLM